MVEQNVDALFGAPGRGDYQVGEQITFVENGIPLSGEVIACAAPQETASGWLPTAYLVDSGDGWPHIVTSGQVEGELLKRNTLPSTSHSYSIRSPRAIWSSTCVIGIASTCEDK